MTKQGRVWVMHGMIILLVGVFAISVSEILQDDTEDDYADDEEDGAKFRWAMFLPRFVEKFCLQKCRGSSRPKPFSRLIATRCQCLCPINAAVLQLCPPPGGVTSCYDYCLTLGYRGGDCLYNENCFCYCGRNQPYNANAVVQYSARKLILNAVTKFRHESDCDWRKKLKIVPKEWHESSATIFHTFLKEQNCKKFQIPVDNMPPLVRPATSRSRSRIRLTAAAKAKKKAEAEAKAAEEARIREEERKREEERLAMIAAEKARKEAELQERLSTPEGQLRDLLKFLSSVPLTKKCVKKLERELSDGVAVAEIVAYFCPEICDASHYFEMYSYENKKSNWDQLNFKVFPELGFQLTASAIHNLIRPYECGKFQPDCTKEPHIYEVLRRVRDGIGSINPEVYDYRDSPETDETPCEEPEKPKFVRQPRVTEDKPPYSKIELEIARGKFDEEDRQLENARRACCYTLPFPECGGGGTNMEGKDCCDWVKFQGPGGGILYTEQPCGGYESKPICPPEPCWKL